MINKCHSTKIDDRAEFRGRSVTVKVAPYGCVTLEWRRKNGEDTEVQFVKITPEAAFATFALLSKSLEDIADGLARARKLKVKK